MNVVCKKKSTYTNCIILEWDAKWQLGDKNAKSLGITIGLSRFHLNALMFVWMQWKDLNVVDMSMHSSKMYLTIIIAPIFITSSKKSLL